MNRKEKIIFVCFVFLILVILIMPFIHKERVKIKPVPEKEVVSQSTAALPSVLFLQETQQPPLPSPESNSAITIVKPAPPQNNLSSMSEEAAKELPPLETTSPGSGHSSVISTKEGNATSSAGLTLGNARLGNRPTGEQKKEMNSRGIILY